MTTYTITTASNKITTATSATQMALDIEQRANKTWFRIDIDWESISEILETVPSLFKPIVDNQLRQAAKDIATDYLKGYAVGVVPATIDSGYFSVSALIDRASNAGIQWLSKEGLAEAWKLSATYQAWIARSEFRTNPKFAKAVGYYSDLITKLSGKTSSYKADDLDLILAKLNADDYSTPMGQFVTRRVEALKAKPVSEDVDAADLL